MGVSGFGPAPQSNLDEFERRLREGVQRTDPNDAPSKPRTTESSSRLPHPALSRRAPNTLECAGSRKESIEPLDVRSLPQLHLPLGNGISIVDAEDPRTLDVDDFRRWWQHRLAREPAHDRSQGRKLPRMAIALAGIALISSALALKGGAPTLLKTLPVAPPANDIARAQNFSGQTAGTPADISTMPPAGLSGTTPIAPEVDGQAVEGLAFQALRQTTDPEPARGVSVRSGGDADSITSLFRCGALVRGRHAETARKASVGADERHGWDNAAFDPFAGATSPQIYRPRRGRQDGGGHP